MATKKSVMEMLSPTTSTGTHRAPETDVTPGLAHELVTKLERIQAFHDHATRELAKLMEAGGKDFTSKWKLTGFIEALDLCQHEERTLWSKALGVEGAEVAEAVMRRLAKS